MQLLLRTGFTGAVLYASGGSHNALAQRLAIQSNATTADLRDTFCPLDGLYGVEFRATCQAIDPVWVNRSLTNEDSNFVNYSDSRDITSLEKSVRAGNLAMIRLLLDHNAVLDSNIFQIAMNTKQDLSIIQLLLERGALIPKNWKSLVDNWGDDDQSVSREKLYRLFLQHGAGNIPDEDNLTDFHRAAREGNLQTVDLMLQKYPKSQIILNPRAYVSEKVLESCASPTQISRLDSIPLEDFAIPFAIAQNFCDTQVQLKTGEIITLAHTNVDIVYQYLLDRRNPQNINHSSRSLEQRTLATIPSSENSLTIHLRPDHAFIDLSCLSCGSHFEKYLNHESFGMGVNGAVFDIRGLEKANERNSLKLTFHINEQQAKDIWNKIRGLKHSKVPYHHFSENCIHFVEKIFGAAGFQGHFADFFTEEQLQVGLLDLHNFLATNFVYCRSRFPHQCKIVLSIIEPPLRSFTSKQLEYGVQVAYKNPSLTIGFGLLSSIIVSCSTYKITKAMLTRLLTR